MDCVLNLLLSASLHSQTLVSVEYGIDQPFGYSQISLKSAPMRLDEAEIQQRMQTLPAWSTDGETLFYCRTFSNFVEAIDFVNSLVEPAEQLAHHPDIVIKYNQVFVQLTTHDAQGLTELDFQLAKIISQL
ncbi:MAG: 4a-hydroxytetrahydrobiopterin dehydratase [Cyanobacteria bacterium P01_H01_bin.21]